MKIGNFDTDKKIMIIAEIGNNHEGNFDLAELMIREASKTGVDAVKFQTFRTEHYISQKDKVRFNRLKSFELKYNEFEKLSKIAKEKGLIFLSTPFDIESANYLNKIVPAFKISSGDNNFYPLIEAIACFGKPIILSSGLADINQIIKSKRFIENIWKKKEITQEIAILHSVTNYPVEPFEANLKAISTLKDRLNCTIGYSDHTIGIEAAVISVVLGARIIEKHFTIDKNYSDFHDHKLSADPKEMTNLVKRIKEVTILMGSGKKELQNSEKLNVKLLRRSIVASRKINKGEIIGENDITWIRLDKGLPAGYEKKILGKKTTKSFKIGEPIILDYLQK